MTTRWCCGALFKLLHLLALSVLQIKVRVEVDHDSLVGLRSLDQPCTLLTWVVRMRVTGRCKVSRVFNFYSPATFFAAESASRGEGQGERRAQQRQPTLHPPLPSQSQGSCGRTRLRGRKPSKPKS